MEVWDRFNALVIIFKIKFFIRAVKIVAIEAEAHENYFYGELLLK